MDSISQEIREYRKPADVKAGDQIHRHGYWYPVTEVVVGAATVAVVTEVRRYREDSSGGGFYMEEKIHELLVDDEVLTESGDRS